VADNDNDTDIERLERRVKDLEAQLIETYKRGNTLAECLEALRHGNKIDNEIIEDALHEWWML
jgi:predicted RNase H-like nuclease (RuvC/YqgF family)